MKQAFIKFKNDSSYLEIIKKLKDKNIDYWFDQDIIDSLNISVSVIEFTDGMIEIIDSNHKIIFINTDSIEYIRVS